MERRILPGGCRLLLLGVMLVPLLTQQVRSFFSVQYVHYNRTDVKRCISVTAGYILSYSNAYSPASAAFTCCECYPCYFSAHENIVYPLKDLKFLWAIHECIICNGFFANFMLTYKET